MNISLPISKSIANRILLLQAIHGDPLMRVSSDMPDDVLVLYDALEQLQTFKQGAAQTPNKGAAPNSKQAPLVLNLKNCGTALRFLQVHIAKCYPGAPITLTGDPRLMERDGKPTTQTTSALILHGEPIPVSENESPYITLSRRIKEQYESYPSPLRGELERGLEPDWSSAAFWYEYVAIHGGELLLEGLKEESLQGDRVVADLYAEYFGVESEFIEAGVVIRKKNSLSQREGQRRLPYLSLDGSEGEGFLTIDFTDFPDLYPAIALTCERLGKELKAKGTERLCFKESDRIEAVQMHEVRNDHRMAMALMAADYPVSAEDQTCIKKSYPLFTEQIVTHIVPQKGINDDGKGKKYALEKLIHNTLTRYVWLHDDDVVVPKATLVETDSDLVILPLRMESLSQRPNLLEQLQIAEYAAIQELTMRTAKAGKAVMCSGANLIVRRKAWLECEPELHPEIPSGDDMFLLEAMKKRGKQIAVIDEPDYTAIVRPVPAWRAFFRQRMRWAGKAPKYTDRDIIHCGVLVAAVNILQVLFPPILLIKFPIEYNLIKKREPQTSLIVAFLLEICYPFYMISCLVGGLLRRNQW